MTKASKKPDVWDDSWLTGDSAASITEQSPQVSITEAALGGLGISGVVAETSVEPASSDAKGWD